MPCCGVPLSEIGRYEAQGARRDRRRRPGVRPEVLDPAEADIVVAGDAKAFLPALKARFPGVEVIKASDLDLDSPALGKSAKVSSGRRPARP